VAEAVGQAFAELSENLSNQDRDDFVRGYLSPEHRDNPGPGCPAAGFAGDLAHDEAGAAVDAYAHGIGLYASELGSLADVATLVGAMILARATAGTGLSDRILDEVREQLVSGA